MYRAYVSDQVVEIRKLPKIQCRTPIGQVTGLEPSTTHCRWEPAADTVCADKRPGIEGMYLLHGHPSANGDHSIRPCAFEDGWRDDMDTTLRAIYKHFLLNATCRQEWAKWNTDYAPRKDGFIGCIDYLADHHFHIPLESWLCQPLIRNVDWILATNPVLPNNNPRREIFQWPQNIVVCQASVVCGMVPNPPPPRNYLTDVDNSPVCDRYIRKTTLYYNSLKSRLFTVPMLQTIVR
jgi:hypothetical protein